MDSGNEIFEKFETHFDATSFFSVPDGNAKGFEWIDEHGQSVDCNIYHPKYGKQFEASFFNVVIYDDPKTGKGIASRYFHAMLCMHEDGTYTNKDGIVIIRKPVSHPLYKDADAEEDFLVIYQREKERSQIKDENFFTNYLIEYISEKEKKYKDKNEVVDQDTELLERFHNFKSYLDKLKKQKQQQSGKSALCSRYPNCDCYKDWEQPASEIDPQNAPLFRTLMKEMDQYMVHADWIRYEQLFEKAKTKLSLLPESLHGLFITKLFSYTELHFSWKTPEKSDLLRLRNSLCELFSSDHDLAYYQNEKNIPNQELVIETIHYFSVKEGKRVFKPLKILNLLNKQYNFVVSNVVNTKTVVQSLKQLPFSDLEKHVLFGVILKWFGGYPINNLDENFDTTLKAIEKEFLSYSENTPEKEFCKADREKQNHFMKLGIAFTTAVNHGINVSTVLKAMDVEQPIDKTYQSFDALFSDAANNGAVGNLSAPHAYHLARSRYNYEFNVYLQNKRQWRYGDEEGYKKHLSKQTFLEFLKYQREIEEQLKKEKENEKQSWRIDHQPAEKANETVDQLPAISIGDLKHVAPRGQGYFCIVKQLKHEKTGTLYALKELKKEHYLKQEYRYRLQREIKLLKELEGCEYIIELIETGEDAEKQNLWYLMPYATQNLFDFIRKNNQDLSNMHRFEIVEQIIAAIKFAHGKSILHRDISPNNILVFTQGGKPVMKVCDFGLGKSAESLSYYTGSSASGYGQILYASPEQRQQLKAATVKSDIYSLGKLVYFIFTGKDPDNLKPFELSPLVSRATEEDSDKRFQSIEEFEQFFLSLKEVHLNRHIPVEQLTLQDVLTGAETIDWLSIHTILVSGNYFTHVYDDYLKPANQLLLKAKNLEKYYKAAGANISEFVSTYAERLQECYQRLGWPFTEMDSFASLLIRLLKLVKDDQVRLTCLQQLWHLAFIMDKWSVQRELKTVFTTDYISTTIETQLSQFLIDAGVKVDLSLFTVSQLPQMVKAAIIRNNDLADKREEEWKKERDNLHY